MYSSLITSSVISRVCGVINNQPPKILYIGGNSFLDLTLKQFLPIVIQYPRMHPDLLNMTYDCYISTDPIMHSQTKHIANQMLMPDMVLVQNLPHKNIKKEDKYLIAKNLQGTIKIFFDINVAKAWDIGHDHIIEYAVPHILSTEHIKNKSIVILKTRANRNIDILYQMLKNQYPDIDLITLDQNTNLQQTTESLSQYKVAITMDNPYDSIVCALSGCYTVSNTPNNYIDTHVIGDFTKIESIVKEALNQSSNIKIHNMYSNIDAMINQLNNIIYRERVSQ